MKFSIKLKVSLGLLIFFTFMTRLAFMDYEEEARHSFERREYCKSLNNYTLLAKMFTKYKLMLGKLYARGFCTKQDIRLAKELYSAFYNGDKIEISSQFIYDGIEIAQDDTIKGKKIRLDDIRSLFIEAGIDYTASEHQINQLNNLKLTDLYREIKFKK